MLHDFVGHVSTQQIHKILIYIPSKVIRMGNLLSSKKKSKNKGGGGITDDDRAILSLKNQRIKLEKERKRLESIIDNNVIVVRTLVAQKRKDRALLALKKKRLREEQMKQLDSWLINVESLLGNIEMARQQNRLYDALKQGADALKEIQKEVSVQDVEKLMEDNAEAKAYQDQIEQALGGGLTDGFEEELLEELKTLENDILRDEVADLPSAPKVDEHLPDVPTTDPVIPQESTEHSTEVQQEEPLLA